MSLWEKYVDDGQLGCGVLLAPGTECAFAENKTDHLILAKVKAGQPLRYYAGAGWDRSGDFSSANDWNAYLGASCERLKAPVTLSYSPAAAPAFPAQAP